MRVLAVLVILSILSPVFPAGAADPLFDSDEMLKAVLTAPIGQAYAQKKQEQRLYLEGNWSYREGEETVRLDVKVRARGNYRRRVCSLPPLQLNFRKKQVADTLFDGQDKLKMVSPCKNGDRYQQLVAVERLVYDLYALYTPHHFRTRLVEVGYNDVDNPDRPWQSTNFLIEDQDAMADRYDMVVLKTTSNSRLNMDLPQTALLEIFQFMIGNVDYSTLSAREGEDCCHNVRLIAPEGATTGVLPVPYDFDSSGIVNAPYATPPESIPIKKVTQRYFTGWCKEEKRFREAIDSIVAKRDQAMALIDNDPLLDDSFRKKTRKYLEKSYEHITDERYVKSYILGRCRGQVIKG